MKPQKKKSFFSGLTTKGGGVKGRATQKKYLFLNIFSGRTTKKTNFFAACLIQTISTIRIRNRKPTSTRIQLDPNSIESEFFESWYTVCPGNSDPT